MKLSKYIWNVITEKNKYALDEIATHLQWIGAGVGLSLFLWMVFTDA